VQSGKTFTSEFFKDDQTASPKNDCNFEVSRVYLFPNCTRNHNIYLINNIHEKIIQNQIHDHLHAWSLAYALEWHAQL
jgi:hypothetical protein